MKQILVLVIFVFFLYIIYVGGNFVFRFFIARSLVDSSEPFERKIENADYSVLVAGDSTAVGTGVENPEDSVAGRLAADYPNISITNLGKNGLRTSELLSQLRMIDEHYDLVILHIGANDILRFSNTSRLANDFEDVLDEANRISGSLVLFVSGNIGIAPIFPAPFGYILSGRTRTVLDSFSKIAGDKGALWVPLFVERGDTILSKYKKTENFYAEDLLHPGSFGYQIWYEELLKTLSTGEIEIPI